MLISTLWYDNEITPFINIPETFMYNPSYSGSFTYYLWVIDDTGPYGILTEKH